MERKTSDQAQQTPAFAFNRMEFAGSLGDLGTLLPLGVGMIMINGLAPGAVFLGVALFYILSGLYYRITCPVEPMKVISAYALATGISAVQIQASCLWLFVLLLFLGATGLITNLSRLISMQVIRGIQLSASLLLLIQGIKLIVGKSPLQLLHQAPEPFLSVQAIGPITISWIIGGILALIALLFLENKKIPAAIIVVGTGFGMGFLLGNPAPVHLDPGFSGITLFPYGIPQYSDFLSALLLLALPQVPMTIGSAVIGTADLSSQYFPETGTKVTHRALCLGMSLANLVSFFLGGMPICQGVGGLASRYRFGARTGGSNLIIGTIFLALVLLFGPQSVDIIHLIPFSALGVLLSFAGIQLGLSVLDLRLRSEMAVALVMAGVTLATNLSIACIIGMLFDAVLKWRKIAL